MGVAGFIERLYPRTRFADELTPEEQWKKVREEFKESDEAGTKEEKIAESCDLQQALETYHDTLRRQGVDIEKYRRQMVRKNAERKYYCD